MPVHDTNRSHVLVADNCEPREAPPLSRRPRWTVLAAVFAAFLFDGMELGMMPVAARSLTQDLLGADFSEQANGQWFSWLMASMMLGAACGGIWLGALVDRIGRALALAVSVLSYSRSGLRAKEAEGN